MPRTRRDFLKHSALMAVGTTVPVFLRQSAVAASGADARRNDRILVVIQLSGGNDGLNTVVPYGDELYAKYRVALRIPRDQVLKIDDYHGLHPAMKGIRELYEDGLAAVVQGVGYPNPSRSHFRSMDIWHTASLAERLPEYGWLGRALDQPTLRRVRGTPAICFGSAELPRALVGRRSVPLVASLDQFRLEMEAELLRVTTRLASVPRSDPTLQFLQRTILDSYQTAEQFEQVTARYKPAVPYPATPLGKRLQMIAQVIAGGFDTRIFYTSIDGFDTHSGQAPRHQLLLSQLSEAVTAFCRDMQQQGQLDRILVMTFSEFGRRVQENASEGTDHGTALPMFLFGGRVRAGLIGAHPPLDDLVDGDLKFHTDFRSVYAAVLEHWLDVPSKPVLMERFEPVRILA